VTDDLGCVQTSCITISLDNGTAIGQTPLSDFKVFPNPASDLLFFDFEFNGKAKAYLINALGVVVLETTLNATENRHQMNVAALPPGFYLLRLSNEKGLWEKGLWVK
jgi:hypothetical protein